MRHLLLAAALIAISPMASAITVCHTTTRGPVCVEVGACPPTAVYVTATRQCVSAVVCYPNHVDTVNGGCLIPPTQTQPPAPSLSALKPAPVPGHPCQLTVEWMSDQPKGATMVFLTDKCDASVDLAVHRIQGRLLGDD